MKNKKLLILLPPLATTLPFLMHKPVTVHADTPIKIVSMNNGDNQNTTYESPSNSYSQSNIETTPSTGIVNSTPPEITSDSQVSDYVPVNVINKNKDQLQKQKEAKEAYLQLLAQREALAKAKALAEKKLAEEQAKIEAQQKQAQQDKLVAENLQKEQESQNQQSQNQNAQNQQPTPPSTQTTAPSYTGGLDMNQTSGLVDIPLLANYMSSTVGGSVDKWIYTITHESGGDLQNWYNKSGGNPYTQGYTAYGVFQLLGHGEYLGMPLKGQIELAQQVYRSQGFGAWVASYGY